MYDEEKYEKDEQKPRRIW